MVLKMNSSLVSYFRLSYLETGHFKLLCLTVVFCLYVLIVASNVLLIVVICSNRSLHEPMYMFLCSLFVNELFGSTGLFPFLLVQILSDSHVVSVSFCFLQIFCVYSYACAEFFSLAVMSFDRYVAICCPLRYNTRMTRNTVALLIAATWFYAFLVVFVTTSLSFSLQLCGNVIHTVFCGNYSVVKLACSDTRAHNVYGLTVTFLTVCGSILLILFTYIKILKVCFSASRRTRQKAVSTCTPHLASLINFSFGCCFQILLSRFDDVESEPTAANILLSLYYLTCQPLLNPIMYGLKMSTIRLKCKRLLCCN